MTEAYRPPVLEHDVRPDECWHLAIDVGVWLGAFRSFNRPPCKVAAVTCTADKPKCVTLLQKYMARQTLAPYRWFVMDAGRAALNPEWLLGATYRRMTPQANQCESMQQNILAGISAALESGADAIAFVEDDDWYAPHFVARVSAAMSEGLDVWGDGDCRLWNVAGRKALTIRLPAYATFGR